MAEFQFDPIDGFKNATSFPDPSTPEEARAQVQSLLDQLRDAYNVLNSVADGASGADNVGATPISTSPSTVQGILEWLKTQIDLVVANGVADDSLDDVKLSDAPDQIKARLADHLLAYAAFVTTKGQVNGIASLGPDGKLTATERPSLSHGSSTQSASFPARTGSGTYVYTPITINIPIHATTEEVVLKLGTGTQHPILRLFRDLNYALKNSNNTSASEVEGQQLIAVNLGYGATITTASSPSIMAAGTLFGQVFNNLILVDAFIFESNIVLKVCNNTASAINSVSQAFEYLARG